MTQDIEKRFVTKNRPQERAETVRNAIIELFLCRMGLWSRRVFRYAVDRVSISGLREDADDILEHAHLESEDALLRVAFVLLCLHVLDMDAPFRISVAPNGFELHWSEDDVLYITASSESLWSSTMDGRKKCDFFSVLQLRGAVKLIERIRCIAASLARLPLKGDVEDVVCIIHPVVFFLLPEGT